MRECSNERGEGGELLCGGERERNAWEWHRLEVLLHLGALGGAFFVDIWTVVVLDVGEEGAGEVEGGVGDEEEVAGEGDEGEEGDEGGALLETVLSGRAEGEEEGHWEGHAR